MQQIIISIITACVCLLSSANSQAKIDLVTLPARDQTQLTVYNSADLTLVREQRTLTLKKGLNRLEFGWENTLIDPTSVQLHAPDHTDEVRLLEVAYPPGTKGSAVWTIESKVAGPIPVEITFFTSGIHWRAFYIGTLSTDETALRLDGYITLNNHSGEDYQNASTRVIVGKIHLLDEIATLAARQNPYNQPGSTLVPMTLAESDLRQKAYRQLSSAEEMADAVQAAKSIVKEGLSEYFLYTIEGTEDILNNWGKRLPSFSSRDIPVKNLYRYEEERYGSSAHHLLTFKNDSEHQLGNEPLPDGNMKFFKTLNQDQHLSYVGDVNTRYIPIKQKVELDFGIAKEVHIEPVLLSETTDNYLFNNKGNISGYDRVQDWQLKLENNRSIAVSVEILRNFQGAEWKIKNANENQGQFEKVDINTVKYQLTLPAHSKTNLSYQLTLFEGERRHSHQGESR